MPIVSITEAAQLLGVSPDTVRRRIRSGNLPAQREATAQGHRWLVEVRAVNDQLGDDERGNRIRQLEWTVEELREALAMAREELRARRAEVHQLLGMVNRLQAQGGLSSSGTLRATSGSRTETRGAQPE